MCRPGALDARCVTRERVRVVTEPSLRAAPQTCEHFCAVERAYRSELRYQEYCVEEEADPEDQGCGFGQCRGGETAKCKDSGHTRPADGHFPELIRSAVGVGEDRKAVPMPTQANDLPPNRSRRPGMTVLMEYRRHSNDANGPGEEEPRLKHASALRTVPSKTKRGYRHAPKAIPKYPI